MPTITKNALAKRITAKLDLEHGQTRTIIQAFMDGVIEELAKGSRIEFRDFGVWTPVKKPARKARNPRTRAPVDVPPRIKVRFKPGRLMKERVQDGQGKERLFVIY